MHVFIVILFIYIFLKIYYIKEFPDKHPYYKSILEKLEFLAKVLSL